MIAEKIRTASTITTARVSDVTPIQVQSGAMPCCDPAAQHDGAADDVDGTGMKAHAQWNGFTTPTALSRR